MRLRPIHLLVVSVLAAVSMWLYVERILIPYQIRDAAAAGRPRGNLSDLYPRWVGSRELLLHGRNPYGADVTREIQLGFYGRTIDPNNPADPKDEEAFAYPVYIAFLLAPSLTLPFETVRAGFAIVLLLLGLASVGCWLHALRWKLSPLALLAAAILVMFCFPSVQGVKLQQLSLFVCALMAAAVASFTMNRPIVAGFLLAFATNKPQLVVFFLAWLVIWTTGDFRKRLHWLYGFVPTLLGLVAAGEYVLPGWIPQFLHALREYRRYTGSTSVIEALLPPELSAVAWAGWACLLTSLLMSAWRMRRAELGSSAFVLECYFALAATLLLIPMFAPYNQVLLVPGIFWILRHAPQLVRLPTLRWLCAFLVVTVAWPWVAAFTLDIGLLVLPRDKVLSLWTVPLFTSFTIPILVFAILAITLLREIRGQWTAVSPD